MTIRKFYWNLKFFWTEGYRESSKTISEVRKQAICRPNHWSNFKRLMYYYCITFRCPLLACPQWWQWSIDEWAIALMLVVFFVIWPLLDCNFVLAAASNISLYSDTHSHTLTFHFTGERQQGHCTRNSIKKERMCWKLVWSILIGSQNPRILPKPKQKKSPVERHNESCPL